MFNFQVGEPWRTFVQVAGARCSPGVPGRRGLSPSARPGLVRPAPAPRLLLSRSTPPLSAPQCSRIELALQWGLLPGPGPHPPVRAASVPSSGLQPAQGRRTPLASVRGTLEAREPAAEGSAAPSP